MHDSAKNIGKSFFDIYISHRTRKILGVGSMDINGTLREDCPQDIEYVGIDLAPGPGVDIVLSDQYSFPFRDTSFDMIVSTSCLEHDQMFWLTFSEMCRVLIPGGYIYINAPSNGIYHAYPHDCWRFYPDAGLALEAWANRSGQQIRLVESFTARQDADIWNDFVSIFIKVDGEQTITTRFLSDIYKDSYNIRRHNKKAIINYNQYPEDIQDRHKYDSVDLDDYSMLKSRINIIYKSFIHNIRHLCKTVWLSSRRTIYLITMTIYHWLYKCISSLHRLVKSNTRDS